MCFDLKLTNLYTLNFCINQLIGYAKNKSISALTMMYSQNFPKVNRKIQMVPIKNGPKIKLKSLKTLFKFPPLTVHHLKGTDNILSITTSNAAKLATGVYFLNSFFGIKKVVNQGIKKRPVLIDATNIFILRCFSLSCLL